MKVNEQEMLLKVPLNWEEHWRDMPEFVQEKNGEYSKIILRFACKKDLEDFSQLVGQKLTSKTKSIWFPFRSHWGGAASKMKYVDES
jgi:hypothetical protein